MNILRGDIARLQRCTSVITVSLISILLPQKNKNKNKKMKGTCCMYM